MIAPNVNVIISKVNNVGYEKWVLEVIIKECLRTLQWVIVCLIILIK